MHADDMTQAGLIEGQIVALESDLDDYVRRRGGLIVAPYDIPRGCLGAYSPEANIPRRASRRRKPCAGRQIRAGAYRRMISVHFCTY